MLITNLLIIGLLFISVTYNINAKTNPKHVARYRLLKQLIENYTDEYVTVPPSSDMIVNVSINIINIFGLNENEVMEMNAWVKVTWMDPKLMWNASEWSGVDNLVLPAEKVWKADVGIANAKQLDCKDFTNRERMTVEATSTGQVSYFGYCLSETPCPIVTKNFPFDEQACPVILTTFNSRATDFKIYVTNLTYADGKRMTVGQWRNIMNVAYENFTGATHGDVGKYQKVTLVMILRRKPMYHIVLVIIPYCLICLLASLIFLINDVSMRFGVSLTILLAKSVYFMIVSQGAPKSMITLSVLDKFLLIQMALLVVMTFIVVLGPTMSEMKTSRAPKDPADDNLSALKIRGVRYRILNLNTSGWNRKCDFIWLCVYLVTSCINGIVCLVIIPVRSTSLMDSIKSVSDLPFESKVT